MRAATSTRCSTAAREAFAEQGPGAPLEDIARRAGVGIGTLYRNFPTRDALVEAVYIDEVAAVVRAADEAGTLEPVGGRRGLAAPLRHATSAPSGPSSTGSTGLPRAAQLPHLALRRGRAAARARAQAAGELREDAAIGDVIRMVSGIAGVAFDDDEQRDRVIAMAIDGLRAR